MERVVHKSNLTFFSAYKRYIYKTSHENFMNTHVLCVDVYETRKKLFVFINDTHTFIFTKFMEKKRLIHYDS